MAKQKKKDRKSKHKARAGELLFDPNLPYPLADYINDLTRIHMLDVGGVLRFTQPFGRFDANAVVDSAETLPRLAEYFKSGYKKWPVASSRYLRYRGVTRFIHTYHERLTAEGLLRRIAGAVEISKPLLEHLLKAEADAETGEILLDELERFLAKPPLDYLANVKVETD